MVVDKFESQDYPYRSVLRAENSMDRSPHVQKMTTFLKYASP